jgi:hypothetical protein
MSFNICTIIKKTRIAHRCCNGHVVPIGQNCYKYSGVEDGRWYNYYQCEFCYKISDILQYLFSLELDDCETVYTILDHYFDIYVYPPKNNIDLVSKKVSYFTYKDESWDTTSFEDFYKIIKENK